MKRFLLFIGLLLIFNNLAAQKKITENTKSNGIDDVLVNVKFANNIVVKNWNKNEISVEATVNIDDNKHNDYFSFKTKNVGGYYTVISDYGEYFKKYRSYYSHKHSHDNDDKSKKDDDDCHSHRHSNIVDYVIYVPKNMNLKVKSISGSVEAESYAGVLNLNLISGNITIKKHSKDMYLKTISGDIDIYISDATFTAKSLSGGIYSDLDIDFDKNKKKGYGSKIHAKINQGTASLNLNTISGDIYLRKI
ncbi:DUF4097 family beta strand repeat-containing protein [Polaribacter porphyrae]|uniref:DUF4097 family beta strand repeat-containing protein n=1 Tax=Polaribacter porphyrae TaxID=1137780 RepID=UPI0011B00C25|nr:DUF4097 family beta strand repeat-containing protein [Polaribacter porphyrae]